MTVLIPCGGSGQRWGNFGGTPKQLAEVCGERLLPRLVDVFHHLGEPTVATIARDPQMEVSGALLLPPNPENLGCDLDKIHCTRPYWSPRRRTWIVWGDLWLTENAAAAMLAAHQPPLVFYGRSSGSLITGKEYGELWGLSFLPEAHQRLEVATRDAAASALRTGEPARAWLVWSRLQSLWPRVCDSIVEINDRTEDFDTPIDLAQWEAAGR